MGYRYLSYQYDLALGNRVSIRKFNVCHPCWRPLTDFYETSRKIYITSELAGILPDQIEILLYKNALVLKGLRRLPTHKASGLYNMAEIRQGEFYLEIPLIVMVDPEQVKIKSKNGILSIILVKC